MDIKIGIMGLIGLFLLVVAISGCTTSTPAYGTYNISGISFQYPSNDWKVDNSTVNGMPISGNSSAILKTTHDDRNGGTDYITITKYSDFNNGGGDKMTAMGQAQSQVQNFPFIGNKTDNATNITYEYYSYSGTGGETGIEQRIYLFVKNGSVYIIQGNFGKTSEDSNIQAMNTILETIK